MVVVVWVALGVKLFWAARVRLESRLASGWLNAVVILIWNSGRRTAMVSWARNFCGHYKMPESFNAF
jgi:hypothetical protein